MGMSPGPIPHAQATRAGPEHCLCGLGTPVWRRWTGTRLWPLKPHLYVGNSHATCQGVGSRELPPASTRTAPGACWVAAGMGLPSPPNQRKAGQLDPVGQMDGMNYAQANLVGTADPPTV